MLPPSRHAAGTPAPSATVPIREAPTGVAPAKTIMYTPMTRPRSSSGTVTWTIVLHPF